MNRHSFFFCFCIQHVLAVRNAHNEHSFWFGCMTLEPEARDELIFSRIERMTDERAEKNIQRKKKQRTRSGEKKRVNRQ